MPVSIKASPQKPTTKKQAQEPQMTVVSRVIKGDTYMVIADSAKDLEDEFSNHYAVVAGSPGSSNLAVEPPFNPRMLKHLVKHNNVLNQCVQAMEINIDGTGHEFVAMDDTQEVNPKELEQARAFFNEPYPGQSFVSQRRRMRSDLESIGWGALEVLRNIGQQIVGLRYVEAQTLRLVRLGEPVQMSYTIERLGQEVELKVMERPRRFMQAMTPQNRLYYKEFGNPLKLDRYTGEWGEAIPPERQATELLFFGVDHDHTGPYYVPRWINQMPSVVGSRKAEEQNLEFFDSGGMPPAIIFIQGGTMAGDSANQLRTYLSASNRKKGRAVVVELAPSTGTIDSTGSVSARVERFGAEKANDSMYSKYDQTAEDHIRVGFRLPPLFLGRAVDYNYATAVVAYQVAEAQVFQPERLEFDEIINKTLIKALGWKTLKFKSLPITMKSVEETFEGLMLLDGKIKGEDLVSEVNKVIGTNFEYEQPEIPPGLQGNAGLPPPAPVPGKPKPGQPQPPGSTQPPMQKTALELVVLSRKYAQVQKLVPGELSEDEEVRVRKTVDELDEPTSARFAQVFAEYTSVVHPHVH